MYFTMFQRKTSLYALENEGLCHIHHPLKLGDYNIGCNGQLLKQPSYMAFLLREI